MARDVVEESRQERKAIWARVIRANQDFAHRLVSEGIQLDYSPDEDYLYLTIGSGGESMAISLPDDPYTVLQVDPETYRVTSIEIVDLKERVLKGDSRSSNKVLSYLATLLGDRTAVYIPPHDELERAEEAIRGLVFA